jgi:hypothetical protein
MFGLEILGVILIALLARRFFDACDTVDSADDVLEDER